MKFALRSLLVWSAPWLLAAPMAQAAFTINILADNDFALFSGTANSINHLLYQNGVSWPTQIAAQQSLSLTFPQGDTTFYLLAMGGGGSNDNISGKVNMVDLVTLANNSQVAASNNIKASLTGYNGSIVTSGAYVAQLSDLQAALPSVTWGLPVVGFGDVMGSANAPSNKGFIQTTDTAILYKFSATSVSVIPEPASLLSLAGLLGGGVLLRRRKG